MEHPIYRVTAFHVLGHGQLEVTFDDGTRRSIDLSHLLRGEIYGPLANMEVFERVRLDEEAGTLVWPNGADFDPAILHDWPERVADMTSLAATWSEAPVR